MTQNIKMPSTSTILSTVASAAATSMLIRSIAKDYLPYEFLDYISSKIHSLLKKFSSQITIVIEEYDGLTKNQLFESTNLYLGQKISPSTQRFRATIPDKQSKLLFSMDENQEIIDVFNGVKLTWRRVSIETKGRYGARHGYDDHYNPVMISEIRYFELSFHKKYKDMVAATYFPYLRSESLKVQEENKTLKLHTLRYNRSYMGDGHPWQAVNLDHPATFDTLGMDIELKTTIMDDLRMFVKRKEFYRKVGKAWKRGYLLFGPPGTGKSSLIGAIANYLNFDVYDLELTSIPSNSDLRKLVISTGNKSILVVEDIDCSIDLQNRKKEARAGKSWHTREEVTQSGLLNFIDGIWSSCGDERLIVFTTNHKDRLDPALLRPGRMDMHIHMSYCTPCGFKMLASNYLGLTQHSLFEEVEPLIQMVKVTPAEVAEQLMKSEASETALRGLVDFLEEKKAGEKFVVAEAEATELEAKAENEQQEIECRE